MSPSDRVSITDDGSSTLYSDQYQAHYHSTHGALQESRHVFIDAGIAHYLSLYPQSDILHILEFGLGSGLNAILTAQYATLHHINISYQTIEAHPVSLEDIQKTNYATLLNADELIKVIHESPWDQTYQVNEQFALHKYHSTFEEAEVIGSADIIYYDAFAPSTQPHLWDEMMMKKCYDALDTNGILVTFCAKGSFKRALKAVGFTVERVPGPPGKREMTRATKQK